MVLIYNHLTIIWRVSGLALCTCMWLVWFYYACSVFRLLRQRKVLHMLINHIHHFYFWQILFLTFCFKLIQLYSVYINYDGITLMLINVQINSDDLWFNVISNKYTIYFVYHHNIIRVPRADKVLVIFRKVNAKWYIITLITTFVYVGRVISKGRIFHQWQHIRVVG